MEQEQLKQFDERIQDLVGETSENPVRRVKTFDLFFTSR